MVIFWHNNCYILYYGGFMRKNRGFTIVELLVSLIIFAVTISIILGLGSGKISRTGLKNSANDVLGMVYKVRMRAAKENRNTALSFTSNSYKEHYYESGSWIPELYPDTPHSPDGTLATGTNIVSYKSIGFNSRGILIDPVSLIIKANTYVILQSDKGEEIKIKVLSYGGIKSKNTWRNWSEYEGF